MGKFKEKLNEMSNPQGYVVTGYVVAKKMRDTITVPQTKEKSEQVKKNLEDEMRMAIPQYKWVRDLKVEPVK
jgi:ribosomal protein S17